MRTMDGNADLFSSLTDTILVLIVSFLPFKEAARTCILSKRWKRIWCYTSNIEFDERFFATQFVTLDGERMSSANEINRIQRRVFIDFVRRWILSYQEQKVDKFRLSLSNPSEFQSDVEEWIRFVITRNVKELDLDFSDDDDHTTIFELPAFVYQHEGLQSLKLSACDFQISMFKNLCALKKLSMGWIELTCSSLQSLVSNCQSLESLSLKKVRNLDHLDIKAQGMRLRSLNIEDCSPLSDGISISMPSLQSLKYFGSLQVFNLECLFCLEEVEIDFGLENDFSEWGDHLCNFLRGINCVKVLTVCSYVTQVLPSGEEPLSLSPPLYDLKHLILKTNLHKNELPGIAFLLKSCPFLETLSIHMEIARQLKGYEAPYKFNCRSFWRSNVLHFDCLRKTLKAVEIEDFKGKYNEVQLLRYLLEEGRALEMVTINTSKQMDLNGGNAELYKRNAQRLRGIKKASRYVLILIR